jgi:putative ABC transport system permease protein
MVTHFMNTGIRVVAAACAVGLALSLAFARVVSGMLYGVSSSDPTTLSAVVVIVLTVSTVALTVPAARIAFLAPMEALREE